MTPRPSPRGEELHALLNTTILQLGAVSGERARRTPVPPPLVPVESLVYRGRAALDRALEIRTLLLQGHRDDATELIAELLDLIVLAAE